MPLLRHVDDAADVTSLGRTEEERGGGMPEADARPFRLYGAPRAPHLELVRERLLDRLDADAALRVVRGPAGSGKTSLLAEWARRRGAVGVWFTATPATTRLDLWRAVARRASRAGLEGFDAAFGPGDLEADEIPERLAEAFLAVPGDVVVVVDDYHEVDGDEVHADVLRLLRLCPTLCVALATRTVSPLESPVVGLELDRTVITADQLPFTPDETARVLRHAGVDLDPATAHVRTGGQPLYLRVAMLAAEMAGSHGTPAHVQVADELLRAAIDKQLQGAARTRLEQLLEPCAVPDILTADLAVALSRDPQAPELLTMLEERGLGTWERRPSGRVFVLFPVVRSLVLETSRRERPEESHRLELATARWYLANGYPVEALGHAVTAGDLDVASAAVSRYWAELLEPHTLARLGHLSRIPVHELRRYPLLAGALAIHHDSVPGQRGEAIEMYRLALAAIKPRARAASPTERVVLEVLESVALRSTGSAQRALEPARRAHRSLTELRLDERRQMVRELPRLRAEIAMSFARGGASGEALSVLDDLGDSPTENPRTLYGLSLRALVRAMRGDMPEAERDLEIIDASPHEQVHAGRDDDLYRLARALVRLERFDARGAQAHLDVMRPHLATLESRPLFATVQAYVDLTAFETALGSERLRRYVDSERGARRLTTRNIEQVGYASGLLNLARGRVGAVHALLKVAPAQSPRTPLLRAHVALLTDGWQTARDLLVERTPPPDAAPRLRVAHWALLAAALTHADDDTAACDALGKLAAVAEDRRLRFALALLPRRDLRALADLAARSRDQTAQRVIAEAEPVPELFVPIADLPQPLTDREIVVLDALMRHATAAEISRSLMVSVNTVKSQLRSVYRKLGVRRREDALAKGIDLGLIAADHVDPATALGDL
ncbi:helix-turn-helix transcriptional regulator [Cellulosimicrobium cellulans]|uniref:helix-turn-helix transcriptional regulator n=1 Tax=Cellulosimicrobium cellulans TaxID=1710 RepID=UPI00084864E4|nr:LuxR C-terminal-related transcriptional regulator [Cellulosimicrobium cellulans]